MISIRIDARDFGKLEALKRQIGAAGRLQLNRVGANAAAAMVQRHVRGYAIGKHYTAVGLGASATGHYEKGAAGIVGHGTAEGAEVEIPIPGISRAFHDITHETPTRRGKRYLTIAKHRESYGRTVGEMRARGWTIYRPGKKKALFGYRRKGEGAVLLYALAERVTQRRDARLLPSLGEIGERFAEAQRKEIERVLTKGGR